MFFCEFPVNPRSLTHASSRVPETHILRHNPHARNLHSPAKLASHIHMQTQRPLRGGAEAIR